jgi:hypothetical protein
MVRRIFPIVMTANARGVSRVSDDDIAAIAQAVVDDRTANPDR